MDKIKLKDMIDAWAVVAPFLTVTVVQATDEPDETIANLNSMIAQLKDYLKTEDGQSREKLIRGLMQHFEFLIFDIKRLEMPL